MTAPGEGGWGYQPGDEEVESPVTDQADEADAEYLSGDTEAASARRMAALEAESSPGERKCPRCGADVEPGQRRCPACDLLVVGTGACPVCGARVDDLTAFCPDCGTPNPRFKREHQL